MSLLRYWLLLYLVVLAFRFLLCAQPPQDTSDLFRHLGFSSHLFERGVLIYSAVPTDFAPEFWTRFWSRLHYIYPPAAMLFFAPLGAWGVGLFYVKVLLTLADFGASLLLWRLAGPLIGFMVLSAPVAVWYTSHEGQYEGLLNLALAATVYGVRRQKWLAAGAIWCVALQLKQFGLLLLPYLLAELLALEGDARRRSLYKFSVGFLLASLPFWPFYATQPLIWFRPFQSQHLQYNPFHWNLLQPSQFGWNPPWLMFWNALFTYAIVVCLVLHLLRSRSLRSACETLPALSFWTMLKSLHWAQFWYVLPAPALTVPLARARRLSLILLVLYWLQCGRSVALLAGHPFGFSESRQTVGRFESCLWRCDYHAP